MRSKESQVAEQVRLNQWALEVQECLNRPKDMTVQQWCEQQGIKKAAYYWRLKRVRQACLEQTEISTEHFVELKAPEHHMIPSAQLPVTTNDNPSTAAVIHTSGGISIEIRNGATADFMKNLMGVLANA